MKFLFDLDETLVSGDIISITAANLLKHKVIDRLYTNNDVINFELDGLPEILKARVIANFSNPQYVWYKHPIPGVLYFLSYLESRGHKLGIVSSRPRCIYEETIKFAAVRFKNIKFELGINFVNAEASMGRALPNKKSILKKLRPDYYFDDNPDYCMQSSSLGIKTFLISNKHTPWNHKFAEEQMAALNPIEVLRNVSFFDETRL